MTEAHGRLRRLDKAGSDRLRWILNSADGMADGHISGVFGPPKGCTLTTIIVHADQRDLDYVTDLY
jgi:hypothetical protein